jgi:superfamily II DNA or RNA helicase
MPSATNSRVSYYFVLTPQAVLQLYRKDSPYSPILFSELARIGISPEDKKILTDYKLGPSGTHGVKELATRLSKSDLPLAPSSWDFQRGKTWNVDTSTKIEMHLSMTRLISARGGSEHFALHLKNNPASTHSEKPFFVRDSQVLYFGDNSLIYSEFPQPLASLLSHMKRTAMLPFGRANTNTPVQVALDGAWLGQLHVLTGQLREHTSLTLDPALTNIKIAKPPKMVLAALHDEDPSFGERFILSPILDWGHIQEDISETFYISKAGGKTHFERRADKSHYLKEEAGELRLTLVDHDLAKNFYLLLSAHAKALGFNSQLQCRIAGEARIKSYMKESWPTVLAFAAAHGIEVRMNNSALTDRELAFSADLAVALEPSMELGGAGALALDATFRIGEHIVTFEELRAFAESNASHLTLRNGESVRIENRDELVRLVRMLRSFESVEGKFRGKLHNAGELKYVMTGSAHYSAKLEKGVADLMRQVETGKPVKQVIAPAQLASILRPYQRDGIDWLGFLRDYNFGGILADDMGLGKTIQTLAFLATTRKDDRPHLVVCPKTLVSNWAYEAQKFVPELRVTTIDGTAAERRKAHKEAIEKKADIIITSYSVLLADSAIFNGGERRYNYVVLDEAQFIKNHSSKTSQLVKRLASDHRLALTGTPLENNIIELWSIMDFLMPGFLGDHAVFMERFGKPVAQGDMSALEHLRRKISVFMLRRTKQEVLEELPPKIEQHAPIALTADQKVLYAATLAQARREIEESVATKGWGKSQIHILAALTKLRQICNHPALVLPEDDPLRKEATSGKMELAVELIEEAIAGNTKEIKEPHKVLVFSQFVGMLELLSLELNARGIKHVTLSGKTQKRAEVIKSFTDDNETCVFLISTRAGGTGLNLTSADTVIIVDPWWNPSVERQAVDRAHRIGQKRSVSVYRLITTGTIEEKIQGLQKKKQGLFDALIEESKDSFGKLTWEDIKELFAD